MGKPRRGISLLLARFFLRPVVPSHLSLRPKNCSLRVTITFSTCAGSKRVTFVLFSEKAKAISFLNDGKRGRSSNQGRTPTPVRRRLCLDFSKAVSHIINTPKDNS